MSHSYTECGIAPSVSLCYDSCVKIYERKVSNDANGYIDIRFTGTFLKSFSIKICIKEGGK